MVKKIILDCDPGMDDSMAIILAAKSSRLDLLAVTTVSGNYPVDVTYENAIKTLELLGREDIPVGKGMAKPLVRPLPKDPFTHGKDGQANANLPSPKHPLKPINAVDLIINIIKENPGEVYIIATAPLTNIAMAMLLAPEITGMIAGIYAISGAFGLNQYAYINATGDTPQSEWNVYVDPEAADIVYKSGVNLVALGLDVATHFDVNFTEEDINRFKTSDKREAWFLYNAISFVNSMGHSAYCTVIDCLAVAYAIDNTLVKTIEANVGIETKDGLTLGMTIMDRRHHHSWTHLPLIKIGESVDYVRFLEMISDAVLS